VTPITDYVPVDRQTARKGTLFYASVVIGFILILEVFFKFTRPVSSKINEHLLDIQDSIWTFMSIVSVIGLGVIAATDIPGINDVAGNSLIYIGAVWLVGRLIHYIRLFVQKAADGI
jgi:hypothetical protein